MYPGLASASVEAKPRLMPGFRSSIFILSKSSSLPSVSGGELSRLFRVLWTCSPQASELDRLYARDLNPSGARKL